jgi:hypothetical protein
MMQHQISHFARFATATALAAAALFLQVSHAVAAERVTDGWQHSIVSQSLEAPTSATDGWLTSVASDSATTASVATDGWQSSIGVLAARDTSSPRLAATDGWLSSIVAEQARTAEQPRIAQAPASPSSSHYGYMDDIAFGSAMLNALLIAAGSIVLVRRRHRGTTA